MAIGSPAAIRKNTFRAIEKLVESGATIVNIHSGQNDQNRVIDFYGLSVLPKLGARIH